jgi:hypothetical protein
MEALGAVVEISMLAVLHPRQNLPFRRTVALQFIGDDDTRYVLAPLEQLAEELLRGLFVSSALYEDIQYGTVLIYGAPEIVVLLVNGDEHLVQMPFIVRPGAPATQLIGIGLAELAAPLADGFVRYDHSPGAQQFLDITVTERKVEIQPDGVADDLTREPMMFVEVGRDWGHHSSSTQGHHVMRRAHFPPEELRREHEYATLG